MSARPKDTADLVDEVIKSLVVTNDLLWRQNTQPLFRLALLEVSFAIPSDGYRMPGANEREQPVPGF